MPYLDEATVSDPAPLKNFTGNQSIVRALEDLAGLASCSKQPGWSGFAAKNSKRLNQGMKEAKLWVDWVEARHDALLDDGENGWKELKRRLCDWLRLKFVVLEHAYTELDIPAVDIADHIVRVLRFRVGDVSTSAGADSTLSPVYDRH